MSGDPLDLNECEAQERAESRGQDLGQRQLDGTKRPAALLHVETDVDVVLDALTRWHREQAAAAHPDPFEHCPASPCRDVREAL